jgi:hypothetical protein
VAIDLQLFGLLLLIVALRHHAAWRGGLTIGLVLGLTVASLFGFNLRHELDAWGCTSSAATGWACWPPGSAMRATATTPGWGRPSWPPW